MEYDQAGDEAITVGRYGNACATVRRGRTRLSFPVWSVKLYRAVRRQDDGVLTWRFIKHLSPGVSGKYVSNRLIAKAKKIAKERRTPYRNVRHGKVCKVLVPVTTASAA